MTSKLGDHSFAGEAQTVGHHAFLHLVIMSLMWLRLMERLQLSAVITTLLMCRFRNKPISTVVRLKFTGFYRFFTTLLLIAIRDLTFTQFRFDRGMTIEI